MMTANEENKKDAMNKAEMLKTELEEKVTQDKIELNKIIVQLKAENDALNAEKHSVEQESSLIQEELVGVKQERINLEDANAGLQLKLELSEQTRKQMANEIGVMTIEKTYINDQLNALTTDNDRLRAENTTLKRQHDRFKDEQDEIVEDKNRQIKETERCQKIIVQFEHNIAGLMKECVSSKEALERSVVEMKVLEKERKEHSESRINHKGIQTVHFYSMKVLNIFVVD
ncbi:uncharacterized protein LOC127868748 [Dreissena polymorpha]|uniref:uncharacterized protein LOC127868748 n=1 Tax=Dreissena polymorpha TaxID=45954 RepID=UPI00226488B1|nr:uncharacterized protein LOC127868748 [Dreissena polymorpha]XP_052266745.1 uncharacterized protein LOC127868748 [Dreissena polymorpha]XP_052266753.1 uncharacterized protein LOC127868748 [Dreissena polymorpha]